MASAKKATTAVTRKRSSSFTGPELTRFAQYTEAALTEAESSVAAADTPEARATARQLVQELTCQAAKISANLERSPEVPGLAVVKPGGPAARSTARGATSATSAPPPA